MLRYHQVAQSSYFEPVEPTMVREVGQFRGTIESGWFHGPIPVATRSRTRTPMLTSIEAFEASVDRK
jgi:hypothetical protein